MRVFQPLVLVLLLPLAVARLDAAAPPEPKDYTYREVDGQTLHAYVFSPPGKKADAKAHAILLFHGGGWSAGSAEWTFDPARRFARSGLVSPPAHVRASTPPTSIVHGEADTLTPVSGARAYCERLIKLGGQCELTAFKGLGHLLTRNLSNQESGFDPDPEARAAGIAKHLEFLKKQGFMPGP